MPIRVFIKGQPASSQLVQSGAPVASAPAPAPAPAPNKPNVKVVPPHLVAGPAAEPTTDPATPSAKQEAVDTTPHLTPVPDPVTTPPEPESRAKGKPPAKGKTGK